MAEGSGGRGAVDQSSHALQVADAYSRLRHWLRDCAASAPIEELRAVLARLEQHRPADEWPEVADARLRYKALRKAKAKLVAALQRAPVDALQEAISHATVEPEIYHSRAQLALSNSIAGLEAALTRARSSGLNMSEDVCAAEVRLRILRRLYKDMEDGMKLHASVSSPSRRSTASTMEPALKLQPGLSTPPCRSTELTSSNGTAEQGILQPMLRVAPLLSISTCSVDEPSVDSPEAALVGMEAGSGTAKAPLRASAFRLHGGSPQAALASMEAGPDGKVAASKDSARQPRVLREMIAKEISWGDLFAATQPGGSSLSGVGKMLAVVPPMSSTVAAKSLSDHLAQHALPAPPSSSPSLAPVMPNRTRQNSRCRVSGRRGRRGRSGSSHDDDSSCSPMPVQRARRSPDRSKLQAELRALSEAHAGLEGEVAEVRQASEAAGAQAHNIERSKLQAELRAVSEAHAGLEGEVAEVRRASEAAGAQAHHVERHKLQTELRAISEAYVGLEGHVAEVRRASEAAGAQAAAVELLSCLDRTEAGQFRSQHAENAAARQIVPKSGRVGSIAWLLLQTNGERRLQMRHLEMREHRLCRENEHLRQHSAAQEQHLSQMELGSESSEARQSLCNERQVLEQRSGLLLEELCDIRLREQELAHENSELRAESLGMQERVIVAGELARHAQLRAEHAVLEVQQAAAEFVGASSYTSESSVGSRALPAPGSDVEDIFDAREAVELCSWDTVPGEVCIQAESLDASGSCDAGIGESLQASGSYEAHGVSVTGNPKDVDTQESSNRESVPIEDFMNEFRRFQSWS